MVFFLSACYVQEFFTKKRNNGDSQEAVFSGAVLGQPLGAKAGTLDDAAVAVVYAVKSIYPPAALRPDPDQVVRRLLKQYRSDGATIAYQIGLVEQYRLLLGGATTDFAKMPQETYDATSLLAVYKVSQEVCRGLVAPNQFEHRGWNSILPYPPENEHDNILWLAQRIIGRPSTEITDAKINALSAIMASEQASIATNWWASGQPYSKYIPVCATLSMDAEALYY